MHLMYDGYKDFFKKRPEFVAPTEKLCNDVKERAKIFYDETVFKELKISHFINKPSEIIIDDAVINTIVDLARIEDFHPVKNPSRYKYAAYAGFWLHRGRPFSIKDKNMADVNFYKNGVLDVEKLTNVLSVNEIFVSDLMLAFINIKHDSDLCCNGSKVEFHDLQASLLYFLRYRHYSAQQLEMLLKAYNACPYSHEMTT